MSLPEIGAHCSLESCHVNDFLPIRCRCDLLFCKDHISPEAHSCSLLRAQNTTPISERLKKLQRCAADKCNKPSLEAFVADSENTDGRTPAVCPRCKQAFCAAHREPAAHKCTAPDPAQIPVSRNEAGRALLSKMFPASEAGPSTPPDDKVVPTKRKTPPSNPKKAAQIRQVELMKMRHRAQPGDPKDKDKYVPVDQRLHVKVRVKDDNEEKIFWFRKAIGTGKALDLLASHFKVSTSNVLSLVCPGADDTADDVILQNDKLLSEQVEDGAQLTLTRRN
ncbi:hypothetical protein NM688_g1136 [Phlebia brevispora]|uniref:Uncharacterized protein n=1 Tax=Phlebia brevispora TaxID=194682 RepID=A0ACC1TCN5_9APHY|nr:hypothetical protein NM688_g1136 [Phlebia brevispora]